MASGGWKTHAAGCRRRRAARADTSVTRAGASADAHTSSARARVSLKKAAHVDSAVSVKQGTEKAPDTG